MAASSRAQVLRLYRALLRESQRFSGYNYRTYAIRRIRDAFRENKNIKDSEKIEELVNKAKVNLEVIHRQLLLMSTLSHASSSAGRIYTAVPPHLINFSDKNHHFCSVWSFSQPTCSHVEGGHS
ncbi:LYR motif-containing protein 4 isoform X2 [Harpia harpyja]|uniref:LYR motif-containing protein 4 isoform X2 n=1 Tax=Harpia harpyja TaxID=202280 RepID=UPI0022B13660|nr:LYR motif-containing protein 4 isoform X2 [Harpia harpyja]